MAPGVMPLCLAIAGIEVFAKPWVAKRWAAEIRMRSLVAVGAGEPSRPLRVELERGCLAVLVPGDDFFTISLSLLRLPSEFPKARVDSSVDGPSRIGRTRRAAPAHRRANGF